MVCELPPDHLLAFGRWGQQPEKRLMKRSAIHLALLLTAALPVAGLAACGDDYQGVNMDEAGVPGGPAGTARGSGEDRYQEAATGTVGTDAAPATATADGRERPDTVYSPAATPQAADTTP
jgi:hypothetical protein